MTTLQTKPSYEGMRVPSSYQRASAAITIILTCCVPSATSTAQHQITTVTDDLALSITPPIVQRDTSVIDPVYLDRIVHWAQQYSKNVSVNQLQKYITIAFKESASQQLDPLLILAIISVESRFDARADDGTGAKGLMQIVPFWHRDKITSAQVFDPTANVRAGTKILRSYLTLHNNDTKRALLNYNGSLRKPGAKYHTKVLSARDSLKMYVLSNVNTACSSSCL